MEITRELAEKVLNVVDAGLVKGMGIRVPGKMCVEAAVCYAMGLPHSDAPSCVSSAIRVTKITLNDLDWSSNQARATGMRRLALAQLGSAGVIDDLEFSKRLVVLCVKSMAATALKKAVELQTGEYKTRLEERADKCARAATFEDATDVITHIIDDTVNDDIKNVIRCVACCCSATNAISMCHCSVQAVHYAAKLATNTVSKDKVLSDFAESVVQLLVEMKAPGCKFLDLAPLE